MQERVRKEGKMHRGKAQEHGMCRRVSQVGNVGMLGLCRFLGTGTWHRNIACGGGCYR